MVWTVCFSSMNIKNRVDINAHRKPCSPGVQWLQDPQSQVYGFTTWLERIVPVENFAFERLQAFVPSSRDEVRNHLTQKIPLTTYLGLVCYSTT